MSLVLCLLLLPSLNIAAAFSNTVSLVSKQHRQRPIMLVSAELQSTTTALDISSAALNWRTYTKGKSGDDNLTTFPFDHCDDSSFSAACWSETRYEEALELYQRLIQCEDSYVAPKIEEALNCLDGAYRVYGPRFVLGSYNGGKDAVVILHLMRAAHAHYFFQLTQKQEEQRLLASNCNSTTTHIYRPRVVYFDHEDEFPEIVSLLKETVDQYDLDMLQFDSSYSFRDGLSVLVGSKENHPLAFVLGTRTSDPNALRQGHFAPSSSYMPPFMRVNPILNWSYGHVWHFLRLFQLPYCSLYDQGYTSLGTVKDTLPCPALRRPQGGYWPAYMLSDWEQERAGRITNREQPKGKKHKTKLLGDAEPTMHQSLSTLSMVGTADGTEETTSAFPSSASSLASNAEMGSTVGLLIIGDEILKGLCDDTNTFAAANALRSNGLLLSRVVVVPDEHDEIVDEVCCFVGLPCLFTIPLLVFLNSRCKLTGCFT